MGKLLGSYHITLMLSRVLCAKFRNHYSVFDVLAIHCVSRLAVRAFAVFCGTMALRHICIFSRALEGRESLL